MQCQSPSGRGTNNIQTVLINPSIPDAKGEYLIPKLDVRRLRTKPNHRKANPKGSGSAPKCHAGNRSPALRSGESLSTSVPIPESPQYKSVCQSQTRAPHKEKQSGCCVDFGQKYW